MDYCELTFATPEENLACDEALLDFCEQGFEGEVLRVWEPAQYSVIVGYANQIAREVNLPFCQAHTIPVLRRCTGGGAVLQGPGCLNYSLVLRMRDSGPLQSIPATNDFILKQHQTALTALLQAPVEKQGHTDLAVGGLKFSGNAQRRKKHFLLFHGSFLLHLDISMVEKALPQPSRQPAYRAGRSHSDFLMNLKVEPRRVRTALRKSWNAIEPLAQIPFDEIARLTREKYSLEEWNLKF